MAGGTVFMGRRGGFTVEGAESGGVCFPPWTVLSKNELSANDAAHSPGKEPAVEAQAVIRFPDWQARLQEKELGEEVRAGWRRRAGGR